MLSGSQVSLKVTPPVQVPRGGSFYLCPFPLLGAPHLSSSFQLSGVACTVTGGGMALPGSGPTLCRAQGSLRRQQMSSASSEEET